MARLAAAWLIFCLPLLHPFVHEHATFAGHESPPSLTTHNHHALDIHGRVFDCPICSLRSEDPVLLRAPTPAMALSEPIGTLAPSVTISAGIEPPCDTAPRAPPFC
jgi:hypothetical protein